MSFYCPQLGLSILLILKKEIRGYIMDSRFSHALNTVIINKCVKYMKLSINCGGISGVLYNIGYIAYCGL